MMGYWEGGNMMGAGGLGTLFVVFWIIIFVDFVLLGLWLWKQLNKK